MHSPGHQIAAQTFRLWQHAVCKVGMAQALAPHLDGSPCDTSCTWRRRMLKLIKPASKLQRLRWDPAPEALISGNLQMRFVKPLAHVISDSLNFLEQP